MNFITRPNCALDRRTFLCLCVPGLHKQVFNHVKILSERSKNERTKEEQRERPCFGICLQCTKFTVWPRNVRKANCLKSSLLSFKLLL